MGKLFVIGIGPGAYEQLTFRAREAMEACDLLCGYKVYIDIVKEYLPDKEYYSTPMRKELERCRYACERAAEGRTVGMLCSGDAGIYGMAGVILKLAGEYDVKVDIVPGITAAVSGAAKLGAPLMNDFCVISLSDLMTPWGVIEKRLRAAAAGDFSIVLYNPMSVNRPEHLKKACEILLEEKAPETVCGYVRNIGREGEESRVLTLSELKDTALDMFTTVFIGASNTERLCSPQEETKMVTGRGYSEGRL